MSTLFKHCHATRCRQMESFTLIDINFYFLAASGKMKLLFKDGFLFFLFLFKRDSIQEIRQNILGYDFSLLLLLWRTYCFRLAER